jgi:ABC-2 type transport system permease protein
LKSWKDVWFIMVKDLSLFARDRLALLFYILFPFFFVILFNFLLAGVGSNDKRLEIFLTSQEKENGISYQIIQSLVTKDESQLKQGEPKVTFVADYDKLRQDTVDKKVPGFLNFPADFSDGVIMGSGTTLDVVTNSDSPETKAMLQGYARAIASRTGSQQVVTDATIALLVQHDLAATGKVENIGPKIGAMLGSGGSTQQEAIIKFETTDVGEVQGKNAANYVIPGYLVMFVFFGAALSAVALVLERENNTLERLLACGVRREAILAGKFMGTAAKGLIQILIFWTVGILAFKIDLGLAPGAVILLSVLMVLVSAAFSLMLSTLVRTRRSAVSSAVLTSLVLAPLGGCWWPLFIVPQWMQFIAKITPHGWANTAFNKLMLFGADFGAVIPEMLVLTGFILAFLIIGIARFRVSSGK